MAFRWCVCMWILTMTTAIETGTAHDEDFSNLPDVSHILPKLNHISDEVIRNMTAVQMNVCPAIPLCTANKNTWIGMEDSADETCCSKCECGMDCIETGSCCVDYLEANPEHYHNTDDFYECRTTPMYNQIEMFDAGYDIISNQQVRLISTCPKGNSFAVRANSWHCSRSYRYHWLAGDYRRGTPVTDKYRVKSYANMYCAMCHGLSDDDLIFWTPSVQGNVDHANFAYTLEDIIQIVVNHSPELNIIFIPPEDVPKESYTCIINTCNTTGTWTEYNGFVELACLYYSNNYRNLEVIYRNIFCAFCNGVEVSPDKCFPKLTKGTYLDPLATFITTYNVSALDPKPRQQQQQQPVEYEDVLCPAGFIWDQVSEACRELSCSFYHQLVHDRCQPVFTQVKGYTLSSDAVLIMDEPVTFSAKTVKNMYYKVEAETSEKFSRIFSNAYVLPFDKTFYWNVVIELVHKQTARDVFELTDTNIVGFYYAVTVYPPPNHMDTLLDLKSIQTAHEEFLNEAKIGDYNYYNTLGFMLTNIPQKIDNHAHFSKVSLYINSLQNMLLSDRESSFADLSRQPYSNSPSTQQSHSPSPSTQQSHSPSLSTQQSHSPSPSTQQSHLPSPSTQQPHLPSPSTQQPHLPSHPTQQSHLPSHPTQQSHTSPPSTQQSHLPSHPTQQSHLPSHPTQQSHTSPPSTQQPHLPSHSTQQSHSPSHPTQQPHSPSHSTQQSHSSSPSTQQSHTSPPSIQQSHSPSPSTQQPHSPSLDKLGPENSSEPVETDTPFKPIIHKSIYLLPYPEPLENPPSDHTIYFGNMPSCTRVKFTEHEFLYRDNYFEIPSLNLTLTQHRAQFCYYYINALCICLDEFEAAVRQYLGVSPYSVPTLNGASSMCYTSTVLRLTVLLVLSTLCSFVIT